MKVRIHRGTREIGGTCIELMAEQSRGRILLDLGRPLDVQDENAEAAVPEVPGLRTSAEDLCGLLISHPHQDHVGLIEYAAATIPVGIGLASQQILDRAAEWLDRPKLAGRPIRHWNSGASTRFGPFNVIPYLVDHSAYDAYALLIEADGQRLYYSGDFRGHGRKRTLFDRFLADPSRNIDVLLMEGTVIGRDGEGEDFPSEEVLEAQFMERFRAAQGLSLVWTSAQNIDRLVTLYRAAKRTGRRLVLDAFTAEMLAATGNRNIPQADWKENIGVYVPDWMRRKIKREGRFELLEPFQANRVYLESLDPSGRDVMLFRPGLLKEVAAKAPIANAQLLYSNWSGYLKDESTLAVRQWLQEKRIPIHHIHTSGHASVPDLKRFASALAPSRLIPIHSFHCDEFGRLFGNVDRKADGEWWQVQNNPQEQST
jgi:ribonuclease J